MAKRGAKKLPVYSEKTVKIREFLKNFNIKITDIYKKYLNITRGNVDLLISENSLRNKINDKQGWNENEFEIIESIINDLISEKKEILKFI